MPIKKIDILNYITNFRQTPNDIKTYSELIGKLGAENEPQVKAFLDELKGLKVLAEVEKNGEKAYQVTKK